MARFHKGFYKLKNFEKYIGDPKNIEYRSGWELKMMVYLDGSSGVKKWNSEGVVIPYLYPVDGKWHRYFVDFYIENKDGKKFLIEVKPFKDTQKPVIKEGKKRIGWRTLHKWVRNQAKWEAAKKHCEKMGWNFRIYHEKNFNFL